MSHRMQADMSARITALHDHISSVSSTHNLTAGSAKKDDHVTSPTDHVTSIEEEGKKKGVCFIKYPSPLAVLGDMLVYDYA